jgi:D-aminopeptidase
MAILNRPRARELGILFSGHPAAWNAITDVPGVEVGHCTLIQGDSVRTGVTAVWPRPRAANDPVFGAWFPLNGNGEMTGTAWLDESGFIDGPILLTNTHSVGTVRDAYIRWLVSTGRAPATNVLANGGFWALPVVAETYDGVLNDINGFHIREHHVVEALEQARSGPVAEGSVGAGTGIICYSFKAGIGTASRVVSMPLPCTVGVLVQANCGKRDQLRIAGVPVGRELRAYPEAGFFSEPETGSIIIVVATDAPLLPNQAKRLAKRAGMGLARTGSYAGNGSGDIFIAFSTANSGAAKSAAAPVAVEMLPNHQLNPLFNAVVDCTEEAIINSLVAAESMTGIEGRHAPQLPLDEVIAVLARYRALNR